MLDKTQKVPGAFLATGPVEAYQFTEEYKDRMFHWAWGNKYPDWEKDIPVIRIDHAMPTQIVRFTDWVVQYATGQQAVMSDKRFRESFREYPGMSAEAEALLRIGRQCPHTIEDVDENIPINCDPDQYYREQFEECLAHIWTQLEMVPLSAMTIPKTTCTWQLSDEIVHSECGQKVSHLNPVEYQMRYCPFCGRSISVSTREKVGIA